MNHRELAAVVKAKQRHQRAVAGYCQPQHVILLKRDSNTICNVDGR